MSLFARPLEWPSCVNSAAYPLGKGLTRPLNYLIYLWMTVHQHTRGGKYVKTYKKCSPSKMDCGCESMRVGLPPIEKMISDGEQKWTKTYIL